MVRFRSLFLAFLILLWEGVPIALFGGSRFLGPHAVSVFVLFGIIIYFLKYKNRNRIDVWFLTPILLLIYCIFVTVISSMFFYENPATDWVPALVNYSPLLLIFLLEAMAVEIEDVLQAILIVAFTASIFLVVNVFFDLPFLQQYKTYSGFEMTNNRFILLKNETAFGIVISLVRFFRFANLKSLILYGFIISICIYSIVVVQEVRLVVGALFISLLCIFTFLFDKKAKFLFSAVVFCFSLSVAPIIFAKYIDRASSTSNYAVEDSSVRWRLITVDHYYEYYKETFNIGFGIMSTSPDNSNILTYSYYKASQLYGDAGYWGVYLADLSLLSALYQFGIVGLAFVVFMSASVCTVLIRFSRRKDIPYASDVGAVGFLMTFLIVSPWPLNFFTLSWPLMGGNVLWYLAALCARLRREEHSIGVTERQVLAL